MSSGESAENALAIAFSHRPRANASANALDSAAGSTWDVEVLRMSRVDTLLAKKLNTFVRLLPDELACLAELQFRPRTVKALTELVHEGQAGHRAFILQSEWAHCYKLVPDGARQIISFPLPGDFMGLRSALLRTSDHSFASLTDAVISDV